jgi:hypothetical protein
MTGFRWRVLLLTAAVVGLTGQQCATLEGAWPPKWPSGKEADVADRDAETTFAAHSGKGKIKVYGASLYSDGQRIFKKLRQQDTLNAFLVCQGEPDFVEIAPGGADRITLTYSRRSAHEPGTVQIVRSTKGYYVAQPIKPPKGRQPAPKPPPPPPPPPTERDPDRDGLDEGEERTAGTDPHKTDTDADGLSDGDEVRVHETDPLTPDSDADALSDGDEVQIHETDPLTPDSDADGLPDGDEVHTHATDPNDSDSDEDGLSDGDEVNVHATNPLVLDSDLDGLSDGFEVASGFDPSVGGEQNLDPDGDGLDNLAEETAETNPHLADTDSDGSDDRCETSVGTDPNDAASMPPPLPQPSASQRDDCPIEPWRADCQALCSECADWEWCGAAP